MKEYIDMFLNEEIIGEEGLLTEIGLIPMNETLDFLIIFSHITPTLFIVPT